MQEMPPRRRGATRISQAMATQAMATQAMPQRRRAATQAMPQRRLILSPSLRAQAQCCPYLGL